jgi:hypothetical protein
LVTFDEAILDIAWKNLDAENKGHNDLDTKAIGLITITGILITFLLGSVSSSSGVLGNKNIFYLTAIFFLFTILISVFVLRVEHIKVLSTQILITELKNKSPDVQIKSIIGTIADMEDRISEKNYNKAKRLEYAIYSLSISIIFLIIYVGTIVVNT